MSIGAKYSGAACDFTVWAPFLDSVGVSLDGWGEAAMEKDSLGYWRASVKDVRPGALYRYRLNRGVERADPASNSQPYGVEGPSEVVDHSFPWEDSGWNGVELKDMVIYELHVGVFTPEGTFGALSERLGELADLGVNAIEIMPVAQFPGGRNWGYDGVFPFSPQNSYGGTAGLKRLVNECHKKGISVILDAVYNHLGPSGNYFSEFGPYFTDKYRTPWGKAFNFDGPYSDQVRDYFFENALHWASVYHIDGLRLDAIHAIYDFSARPFLKALKEKAFEFSEEAGRPFYIISESDLNDPKVVEPRGFGHDAVWCDDFHHSLHALLTGERDGYYADFGGLSRLAKSLSEGYVYSGQHSRYRKMSFGASSAHIDPCRFVVFSQNHDQTGNRMLGERLSTLVDFERLKLAAGVVLLSPYIPLLFMGEEYGETAPFLYFIDHADGNLVNAIRSGRKEEFKEFVREEAPPDPQSEETFIRSKLDRGLRERPANKALLGLYRDLLIMRKEVPALRNCARGSVSVEAHEEIGALAVRRSGAGSSAVCAYNFSAKDVALRGVIKDGRWAKACDSAEEGFNGPGGIAAGHIESGAAIELRPLSFAVFIKES